MASCRKHLDDDSKLAHKSAFVTEGIERGFTIMWRNPISQRLRRICLGIHNIPQACVFFLKGRESHLTLHTHPTPRGRRTPHRCPWSCSPCRCRSRRRRCVRGRWGGCLTRAGWTGAAGPTRWPKHAHLYEDIETDEKEDTQVTYIQ